MSETIILTPLPLATGTPPPGWVEENGRFIPFWYSRVCFEEYSSAQYLTEDYIWVSLAKNHLVMFTDWRHRKVVSVPGHIRPPRPIPGLWLYAR